MPKLFVLKNFVDLGIKKDFVKGLSELGIKEPSKIQEEVIPILLEGNVDLVGQAQTGTGKTAAFGLPLLQSINPNSDHIQGLVLCPTRELGKQIAKQLFRYTKYSDKIFTEAVYGGEHIEKQLSRLSRTTHIIVATPGRLIDLVKKDAIDLSQVNTLILDEADEMLSMGFKKDLEEILSFSANVKNKWLFSATIPADIEKMISTYLAPNAVRLSMSSKNLVNEQINHQYLVCEPEEKLHILMQFLNTERDNRGVVFCKTKNTTKTLTKQLIAKNIKADAIHGDLLQKERDKVMRAFKNEKVQILVATDVAARGIDVKGLNYVVHFELPQDEEYYTHRSGRTARAGKNGTSLCIVTHAESKQLKYYEKNLGIKFTRIQKVR
ncbi:MAG: ATP-dependent RNA helicase DeaD [Arenicella sp.]|jgi:ATP-dependent RNA helicase DeaD